MVWMFGHAATFQEVRMEQYPVGSLSIGLKGKRSMFAVSFAPVPRSGGNQCGPARSVRSVRSMRRIFDAWPFRRSDSGMTAPERCASPC